MTTVITAPPRNTALTAARVLAGLMGANQLAGATYFLLVAPEEAVWLGPWVDVPVVAVMLTGMLLKMVVALWPGLPAERRISLGLLAVGLGMAVTLLKIPLYDEPEGLIFLLVYSVLLLVLLAAWRADRRG